jgi:hypothetical protein
MLRHLTVAVCALALAPAAANAASWSETFAFGSHGAAAGQFDNAIGLDVAADDASIWVADGANNRVQRFAADGTSPTIIGAGQFSLIEDVVVANRGLAFASDCYGNRIMQIDRRPATPTVSVFYDAAAAVKPGETLSCPEGLAMGPDGYLYVADTFHDRVVVLNPGAEFPLVRTIGEGRLRRVSSVAFDPAGHLVVASDVPENCANSEVVTFDRVSGAELSHFGTSGGASGQLYCVNALGVDAAGNVYAGDATGRVQAFTPSGQIAGLVAAAGTGVGQTAVPMDIVTSPDCSLLVVDRDQNRVKRFTKSPAGCAPLPAVDPATIVAAPRPPLPGTGGTGSATKAPLTLTTALRPKLSKSGALLVAVRCGAKPCDLLISGKLVIGTGRKARSYKLKSVSKQLGAGVGTSVSLRVAARQLPAIQRALRSRKTVRLRVDGRLDGKLVAQTSARLAQ